MCDLFATHIGLADGRGIQTEGTIRNLIHTVSKSLLVTFIGRESELESYGYQVAIGTAAGRKPAAKKPPTG